MLLFVRNPAKQLATKVILVSEEIKTYDHKNETSAQEKMKFSKYFLYASRICAPTVHRLCRPWI